MKAITLWQPWASLVAAGAKRVETRGWSTAHRGPLAIHAARHTDPLTRALCRDEPFASALRAAGYDPENLPTGAVVALCRLENCVHTEHFSPSDRERAFGDFREGRFAWLLREIVALPEPIPARGGHRIWEWEAPEGVTACRR